MPTNKPCDICGEVRETAKFGSRYLCGNCFQNPVAFEAECKDCDWEYRREDTEPRRHPVKTNVQMEANNHETEKDVFEDEQHSTEWREVDVAG